MMISHIQNILLVSLLSILFLFSGVFVSAQIVSSSDLVLSSSPRIPGPNETVEMSVSYYLSDINRAEILWYKNGVLSQRGVGIRNFSFKTGSAGSATSIRVVVNTQEGISKQRTLTFRPVSVDILWETDSSVPLGYDGKALPNRRSIIKAVAVPHFVTTSGTRISPSNLLYEWEKDEGNLREANGQGRDSIIVQNKRFSKKTEIKVTVSTRDGSMKAVEEIVIDTVEPEIVFYEEDPLSGPLFSRALASPFSLSGTEVTVRGEPFYFSSGDTSQTQFQWIVDGNPVFPRPDNPKIITLIRDGVALLGGSSLVELVVENIEELNQRAQEKLRIEF